MKIGILGGGSWGATLANVLCDNGHEVLVYDRHSDFVDLMNNSHAHPFFDAPLNENLKASLSIEEVLDFSDIQVLAVPTKATRDILGQMISLSKTNKLIINVSKGIEPNTLLTVSEVCEEVLGNKMKGFVTLSGPSHAEEVILRKLTLLVAASSSIDDAKLVQKLFSNDKYMRVYTSTDLLGVEVGGSVKNAIALVSGAATGLGLGENARAALISRGAIEVVKITLALGGREETVFGLTGIGDLIVTASSMNSRNFKAGLELGRGKKMDEVISESKMVVEGARTLISCHEIAIKYNLDLPIINTAYECIYGDKPIEEAITTLLTRKLKAE